MSSNLFLAMMRQLQQLDILWQSDLVLHNCDKPYQNL